MHIAHLFKKCKYNFPPKYQRAYKINLCCSFSKSIIFDPKDFGKNKKIIINI
jgi:hypothetical protein